MMQEAVKAIAALSRKNVIVAAPSSSAVGILKKDDFSLPDVHAGCKMRNLFPKKA
jgi:hypothetical protein